MIDKEAPITPTLKETHNHFSILYSDAVEIKNRIIVNYTLPSIAQNASFQLPVTSFPDSMREAEATEICQNDEDVDERCLFDIRQTLKGQFGKTTKEIYEFFQTYDNILGWW